MSKVWQKREHGLKRLCVWLGWSRWRVKTP